MALESLMDSEEFINVLYYGEPGTAKTSHAASMALAGGKIIVVDVEAGVRRRPLQNLGIPVDNIMVAKVRTYQELSELTANIAATLAQDPAAITGVVIDSMTELTKRFTDNLVLARFNKRTKAGMVDDEFEVELGEHGKVTEQLRRVARNLRDLPCHTVFTALEKQDKDKDMSIFYRPALGPKFANDLMSFVDIVVHTSVEKDAETGELVRLGTTSPIGKYRGKDRMGCLPTIMVEPTFHRITQVVGGELTTDDVAA